MAVIVQKMVNADKSGVIFTLDPTTGNHDHIVIEAAWGLGELVVQGDVRPDRYVVDKSGHNIAAAEQRLVLEAARSAAGQQATRAVGPLDHRASALAEIRSISVTAAPRAEIPSNGHVAERVTAS